MKIFEFAIMYTGKKDVAGNFLEGELPRIVAPTTVVLASTIEQARLKAAQAVPQEFMGEKLDRVEVAVRPFCG